MNCPHCGLEISPSIKNIFILKGASKNIADRAALLRGRARSANEDQILAQCPYCNGLIETDHKHIDLSNRAFWIHIFVSVSVIALALGLGYSGYRIEKGWLGIIFFTSYILSTVFLLLWSFKKWILLKKVEKNTLNKKIKILNK